MRPSVWQLVVSALLAAGCGQSRQAAGGLRVVSLVPSVTEDIFALGAGGSLAGTTNQCDYPEAARRTFKVGDFATPDVERIAALRPDLVFVALPLHAPLVEKLQELGIRTYASQPGNIAEVLAEIESVGVLLGRKGRARAITESLAAQLGLLPSWSDTPGVYIEISAAPMMTVGGRTFVADIVRRAGGRNVFDDAVVDYPVVTPEDVAARNPDVVLVLHPGTSRVEVAQRVGWQRITAVRTGRIHDDIDDDLLMRPGPRAVEGVLELAKRLHDKR